MITYNDQKFTRFRSLSSFAYNSGILRDILTKVTSMWRRGNYLPNILYNKQGLVPSYWGYKSNYKNILSQKKNNNNFEMILWYSIFFFGNFNEACASISHFWKQYDFHFQNHFVSLRSDNNLPCYDLQKLITQKGQKFATFHYLSLIGYISGILWVICTKFTP